VYEELDKSGITQGIPIELMEEQQDGEGSMAVCRASTPDSLQEEGCDV
jgi:hypothetical protein